MGRTDRRETKKTVRWREEEQKKGERFKPGTQQGDEGKRRHVGL